MRFFRDDPTESTIHWYFVDDDTPELPFGTAFTSNVWLDVPEGDQDIGEVPGAERVWQDGTPPFPVAGDGHYCGTQEDFQLGGVRPDPPVILNRFGGLACCRTPPEPFVFFSCPCLPQGCWETYTLIASGATGQWVGSNGSFELKYQGTNPPYRLCTWVSTATFQLAPPDPLGPYRWGLIADTESGCAVAAGAFRPGANLNPSYAIPGWDPYRMATPAVAPLHPAGSAPFVVVLPGVADVIGPFCPGQGRFLPSSLAVRFPSPVLAFGHKPMAQDAPFEVSRPCNYNGLIWWVFSAAAGRVPVAVTSATLVFGAAGLITLSGDTPLGSPFAYTATQPAWDLSPVGLLLEGGAFPLLGMPTSVELFTQGDLPP